MKLFFFFFLTSQLYYLQLCSLIIFPSAIPYVVVIVASFVQSFQISLYKLFERVYAMQPPYHTYMYRYHRNLYNEYKTLQISSSSSFERAERKTTTTYKLASREEQVYTGKILNLMEKMLLSMCVQKEGKLNINIYVSHLICLIIY